MLRSGTPPKHARVQVKQEAANVMRDSAGPQPCEIIDITGEDGPTEDHDTEIAALLKKTNRLNMLEVELAHKTQVITKQEEYISKLEEHLQTLSKSVQAMSRTNLELRIEQGMLQEQLRATSDVRQILEMTRHATDILSSTLEKERVMKRHRNAEGVAG